MKSLRTLSISGLVASAAMACTMHAYAATVAAGAETLGATAQLQARLPAVQEFSVAAAGAVRITLTDRAAPQAFTQLRLLVSRGGAKVASLDAAGVRQFDATPGTYRIQVVGTPAAATATLGPGGTFDVEVRELTGNTVLRQYTDGIAVLPPPPTAQSALGTVDNPVQVTVEQAGTYQVSLADRSFPAALSAVDLLLVRADGAGIRTELSGPCVTVCTAAFTAATAGTYNLIVVATAAAPDEAGLYSLKISGGPASTVLYADSHAVGKLPEPVDVALPAADAYSLATTDHATPAALATLRARLMQRAEQLAALDAAGGSATTAGALAGTAKLYVFGKVATGAGAGAGVYTVTVARGAQNVHRSTRTLPDGYDATNNVGGYLREFTVPSSGDYRLRVRDLAFTTPLSRLAAVVVQNGATRLEVRATDAESVVALGAGKAFLAVLGSPQTANGNSLLGVALRPDAGGAATEEWTQGVGPLISSIEVNVPAAGSHDLTISDLQFPAAFSDLAVAMTRGPELVAQIYGGGPPTRFNALAGKYYINLLARPGTTAQYGTWGFELATSPPPPTVTLAAASSSVNAGGTTGLTWSSTNATGCTASGGWSGTRATSGTATTAALTADTVFSLSCTGAGGSASTSVTVTIATSSGGGGSGGGGALGIGALLALASLLTLRQLRPQRG
jgi:hypothetical protein